MKHYDSIYLRHILGAIVRIDLYLRDKDEAIFKQDTLLQDGVIRQLEITGGATKQLSKVLNHHKRSETVKYFVFSESAQ
jgi:uncharacterized protein with HEPN domain